MDEDPNQSLQSPSPINESPKNKQEAEFDGNMINDNISSHDLT